MNMNLPNNDFPNETHLAHTHTANVILKQESIAEVLEDNFIMSQQFPLPSISTNVPKRISANSVGRPSKQARYEKKTLRTVVCIPYNSGMITESGSKKLIKIPRGYRRTCFSKLGLITKVEIGVRWTEERLRLELSNVFKHCFADCDYLTFNFLATMPEFKILEIPEVHPQYQWDAAAVTSLSRDLFYILADQCHILKEILIDTPEVEAGDLEPSSSVNELPVVPVSCVSSTTKGQVTSTSNISTCLARLKAPSTSLYNDYLKILSGAETNDSQTSKDRFLQNQNELGRLKDGVEVLESSLRDLKAKINDEKINYVFVNRQTLFDDAILNVKRKNLEDNARFFVKFSDDLVANVDKPFTDGQNREYFRLLIANLVNSSIFAGEDNAKYLTKCDTASSQDHYFLFGRLMALSIIHGGPGPCCFSRLLYQQMLNKSRTYTLSLIASSSTHELISKISNATTAKEFSHAISKAQLYLELAGISQADFTSKNEIVASCLKFYFEDRVKENLERFMCGLNTLGLLDEIMKHPKGYESVFMHDEENGLTATKMIDSVFTIHYSDGIEAKREFQIIEFWQNYLFDVEEGKSMCRLEDILIFCTGADRIPPAGFDPKASIVFSKTSKFPESRTCSNILSLPLGNNNNSYEWFRDLMDFSVLNSQGFG